MSELRESIGRFLVASSMKRSDQPDTPYIKVMGPTVADLERVLAAARLVAAGEVIAKADMREVRWCTRHVSWTPPGHRRCYEANGRSVEQRMLDPDFDWLTCHIVSAALHLEGTE